MVVASGRFPGSGVDRMLFTYRTLRATGPGGPEVERLRVGLGLSACWALWSSVVLTTNGLQRVHQDPLVFPRSCDFPEAEEGVFVRSPAIHMMTSPSFISNGDFQTLQLSKGP